MDGNRGVDEVTRRRRSFISSSAFSVYLSADLTTLSAMCLFILGLGRFSKGQRNISLDTLFTVEKRPPAQFAHNNVFPIRKQVDGLVSALDIILPSLLVLGYDSRVGQIQNIVILCMCFIVEHGSLLYFSMLFCFSFN